MTRRKGDDDEMDALRKIDCAEHGSEPWRGDVVCATDVGGCGRVFQTRDDQAPHFAPFMCACGKQLMSKPPSGDDRDPNSIRFDWTARAVCAHCFEERANRPTGSFVDIFMTHTAVVGKVIGIAEKVVDDVARMATEAMAADRAGMLAEMRRDAGGIEVKLGDYVGVSVVRGFTPSKHGGSGEPVLFIANEPLTKELALQIAAIFALATMEESK